VWALVGRERADGFPETWLARYRAQFPAAHQSTSFIAPPGPPVTEL
jgi:hypothetical protein